MVLSKRNLTKKRNNKYKSKTKSKSKYNKKNVSRKTMRGGAVAPAPPPEVNSSKATESIRDFLLSSKIQHILVPTHAFVSDPVANNIDLIIKMIELCDRFFKFTRLKNSLSTFIDNTMHRRKNPANFEYFIVTEYLYIILIIYLIFTFKDLVLKEDILKLLEKNKAKIFIEIIFQTILTKLNINQIDIANKFILPDKKQMYFIELPNTLNYKYGKYGNDKYIIDNIKSFNDYINTEILPKLGLNHKNIYHLYEEYSKFEYLEINRFIFLTNLINILYDNDVNDKFVKGTDSQLFFSNLHYKEKQNLHYGEKQTNEFTRNGPPHMTVTNETNETNQTNEFKRNGPPHMNVANEPSFMQTKELPTRLS